MDEPNKIKSRIRRLVILYLVVLVIRIIVKDIVNPSDLSLFKIPILLFPWVFTLLYLYFYRSRIISVFFLAYEIIETILGFSTGSIPPITGSGSGGDGSNLIILLLLILILVTLSMPAINILITFYNFKYFIAAKKQNIKQPPFWVLTVFMLVMFCFLIGFGIPGKTIVTGYSNFIGEPIKETIRYPIITEDIGMFISYYQNGKPRKVGKVIQGKRHGEFKVYDIYGYIEKKMNYSFGIVEGKLECFDRKKNVIESSLYKDGKPVYRKYLYPSGKTRAYEYFTNGNPIKIVNYSEEGKKVSTEIYNEDSIIIEDILEP